MKPATKEDIIELMESYVTSAALCVALEIGLFWIINKEAMSVQKISKTVDIPLNRCQHWLDIILRLGLLEKVSKSYITSDTARTVILDAYSQETWAFLAQEERENFPSIFNMSESIHDRESVWSKLGLTTPDYIEQMKVNPERAIRFTRMLYEIHLPMAEKFADCIDMNGVKHIMDLGGGSGVMSMALLRKHPDLSAVVVDMKNICKAGCAIAEENNMTDRINYLAIDFFKDELPTGFDMVLECDLDIHNKVLFQKIYKSLNPDGRLVLIDQFAPEEGMAPPARLNWEFRDSLDDPDYTSSTITQIQSQLISAGFKLKSYGPFADGWHIIEAVK